jgi:epimerase transport system membrane fusion protein
MNAQITAQRQTLMTQIASDLRQVHMELSDLRSRISALKDTLKRTVILAPVEGVVTNLKIHTIGGIIPSGQPILEIVPRGEPLIIEGKVAANEVTNIRVGLETEIRFPNFAHVKSLDVVEGKVIFVAPDAVLEEQTQSLYYPVKIQITPEGEEELQKNQLSLQSGMPVETMIVVGSRTFMDYMIKPLTQMFTKAFNEE